MLHNENLCCWPLRVNNRINVVCCNAFYSIRDIFSIKLRINGFFFLQIPLKGKRKRLHLLTIGMKSIMNFNPKSTRTTFKKSVRRSRAFSTLGQYFKSPAHKKPKHSERNWFSPILVVNQATEFQYDDSEFETDSECFCFHFQIWMSLYMEENGYVVMTWLFTWSVMAEICFILSPVFIKKWRKIK